MLYLALSVVENVWTRPSTLFFSQVFLNILVKENRGIPKTPAEQAQRIEHLRLDPR